MFRCFGNLFSGASIAFGLAFVTGDVFTWPWFCAVIVISFGTTIGDMICQIKGPAE
jgi:hypothetical protein